MTLTMFRFAVVFLLRTAERRYFGELSKEPPRNTRPSQSPLRLALHVERALHAPASCPAPAGHPCPAAPVTASRAGLRNPVRKTAIMRESPATD